MPDPNLGLDVSDVGSYTEITTYNSRLRLTVPEITRYGYQLPMPSKGSGWQIKSLGGTTGKRGIARGGLTINTVAIGLPQVREEVSRMSSGFTDSILERAQKFASELKAAEQAAASAAYRKGTGRFARGISTRVTVKKGSDNSVTEATVTLTLPGYRETRFLTNIGNQGRFKSFPVEPYYIFPRGGTRLQELFEYSAPTTKLERRRVVAAFRKSARRLKVPRRGMGIFLTSESSTGRGLEKKIVSNDILGALDAGDLQSAHWFYPLWVHHPGFAADVVAEVAAAKGMEYQQGLIAGAQEYFVSRRKTFTGTQVGPAGAGTSTLMGSMTSTRYQEVLQRTMPNPYSVITPRR